MFKLYKYNELEIPVVEEEGTWEKNEPANDWPCMLAYGDILRNVICIVSRLVYTRSKLNTFN